MFVPATLALSVCTEPRSRRHCLAVSSIRLEQGTYIVVFLEEHRESAFHAETVTFWLNGQKKRDDQAPFLLQLLHLLLHRLQRASLAVLRRRNLGHNPVLFDPT